MMIVAKSSNTITMVETEENTAWGMQQVCMLIWLERALITKCRHICVASMYLPDFAMIMWMINAQTAEATLLLEIPEVIQSIQMINWLVSSFIITILRLVTELWLCMEVMNVKADREPFTIKERKQLTTERIWKDLWKWMMQWHQFVSHLGIRLPSMKMMNKWEIIPL